MRTWIGTAAALLLLAPQALLAQEQHHGGGGGGGPHGGGGAPHAGGGGAPHGGPPGGGHFGGGAPGGGDRHGGRPAGVPGGGQHGQAGGFQGNRGGQGGRPDVVINNTNRTVVRNDVRGGPGGGNGRGLPAPPRGNWHRGWYGGQVAGFRPVRAPAFRYPSGWGYRRWGIGLVLPSLLFGSSYYYNSWSSLGAYPPPPGDRWVRYGPDLLLVNIGTGRIDDAIYGAFY